MNKNSYYFFKWDIYNLIGMSDESVILLYNIEKRIKMNKKEIILQQNIQLLRRGLRRVYGLFFFIVKG